MTMEKRNVVEPERTTCDKCTDKAAVITETGDALCTEHLDKTKSGAILKRASLEREIK